MEKTDGTITSLDKFGNSVEESLFAWSEDEKQEHEVNKENAKLVFSPKFIPFYPHLLKKGLTMTEVLIFGFVDFYLSNNSTGRFYFTNEQISEICNCSIDTISNSINKLSKLEMITIHRKRKSNGGQIRFISIPHYGNSEVATTEKPGIATTENVQTNNNNINNNKIKVTNVTAPHENKEEKKEYGNKDINAILSWLLQLFKRDDFSESKQMQRNFAKHLCSLAEKISKEEFKKRCIEISKDAFKFKNCGSLRYIYSQVKSATIEKKQKYILTPLQ